MVDCPQNQGSAYTLMNNIQLFKFTPNGTNNKFYIIQLILVNGQHRVWIRYGRCFTEGYGTFVDFANYNSAANHLNTLALTKKRKGYKDRNGGADEAQVNFL